MPILNGSEFSLEVSDDNGTTWEFVEDATNWQGGGERQNQSFARFHNTNKHVVPGQREDTYTFNIMYNDTDPGQEILRAAEEANTDIMIRITRTTAKGFRQVCAVGTISDDNDPENPQQQTVTVTGKGPRLPYAAA